MRSALVASLALLSAVFAAGPCPQLYSSGSNGFCYQYTKIAKSFKAAAQRCAADGAHLASVPNVFANEYIYGLLNDNSAWFGLSCPSGTKSDCDWDSGMTYSTSGYNNFAATGGNSSTNCVYMRSDSTWSFDVCSTSKSFVCELPESTYAPCYGFLTGSQQCFKPDYNLDYFSDAEQRCKDLCSDLAYIPSQAENDRITAGLCWECNNVQPLAKIGLVLNGSTYSWTNGKSFNPQTDYSNFAFVRSSLGNCVGLALYDTTVASKAVKRGQWVNVNCNAYGPSICSRAKGVQCPNQ